MIILGVDPGLAVTGYGVIYYDKKKRAPKLKEAGVVRTDPKSSISERLSKIYENVTDIIKEYAPEVIVLEKLYSHYKHPVTALLMGHARGVVCLAAGAQAVKLISYPSTRIKKAVTGSGHASKMQIQGMVKDVLGLKKSPEPVDVSDALACALTYTNVGLR